MQANISKTNYATLERELGAIRASGRYNHEDLKRLVVYSNNIATEGRMPEYAVVGHALRLSGEAIDELREFYRTKINPINECLSGTKGVNQYLVLLRSHERISAGNRGNFGSGRKPLAEELAALFKEHLGEDSLVSAPNIKEIIMHPLLVSMLNAWKRRELDFIGRLVNVVEDNEKYMLPDQNIQSKR